MKIKPQKETDNSGTRPFVLVKAFTVSSLVVMLTATIVIAALNAHWVRKILLEKSKEYNQLLVENLNHQIFLRFVWPVVFKHGEIKLREPSQYQLLDTVVKNTLHSFHVEMVNIYATDNVIAYSLDKAQIGKKNAGGVHYEKAMKKKVTSKLVQQGNRIELTFWFPQETKIVTFAPLMQEVQLTREKDRMVIGVIEIIRDVSDDYQQVFKLQGLIVVSCATIMGILFLILRFVVKHGESIIERRAEERLKLEEKLRQTEHLSAIGEMTAGVSHEIRNPLGIIKSSAQLMEKKMAKLDPSSNIPGIIVEESTRLDRIITDFLDFAKPKIADLRPCCLEDIIEKNITFLSSLDEHKDIKIIREYQGSLPVSDILGDSAMLYQAFLNIFLNAFQAMDQTDGSITIATWHEPGFVHASFTDTGPGIDEDVLKKIWTPFFTTKEMGTGLGLGIIKNIIQAHHGEISITNAQPSGTRVEIRLPAAQ
ncbi:two-component system sensor histidine kinase NtrB [Desulfobacter postgatei]|uniref:histidine kinase n=1 Tax=Desulfobacter postgatei 2ac9 TaxID=879212 RepID=I5B4N6_9BACT|nr:ATP-binding protein [Desulfobacter postgatei]EIM64449.1 signal transduction histidine kinase [Desulfobacter postgatei 2ac9]